MKHKYSFILLEVVVALALVALCAYPLIHAHFSMTLAECERITKSQLERYADETYGELVCDLYENQLSHFHGNKKLSWQALLEGVQGAHLVPGRLIRCSDQVSQFMRHYEVRVIRVQKEKKPFRALLQIDLTFFEEDSSSVLGHYVYKLPIKKMERNET